MPDCHLYTSVSSINLPTLPLNTIPQSKNNKDESKKEFEEAVDMQNGQSAASRVVMLCTAKLSLSYQEHCCTVSAINF